MGTWRLVTWRRYGDNGGVSYPFGEHPDGILVYTPDGYMAVQMVRADRPSLHTEDALGGSEAERAGAYSTCLAYFGRYRVDDQQVIHLLDGSLFPNWSGTSQVRPFKTQDSQLVLQVKDADGRVSNEIAWRRAPPATVSSDDPAARLTRFVQASVQLTGFSRIALLGTGVAAQHLEALETAVPGKMVDDLLALLGDPAASEETVADCLATPDLGPLARNIIILWYCGSWQQLPEEWCRVHGRAAGDETHVVSAAAYLAGLQWKVVGAHPPGGNMQGFGAWSSAPTEDLR